MALKSFGTRSFAAITFVALFGTQAVPTSVVQPGMDFEVFIKYQPQELTLMYASDTVPVLVRD